MTSTKSTKPARTTAVAGLAMLLALTMAACSSGSARAASKPDARSTVTIAAPAGPTPVPRPAATIDRLVAARSAGPRMHLRCQGSGPKTVVLVSGFGDDGDSWGAVIPTVAKDARVCSFAGLGMGTSDRPARVQTFATEAAGLHDLLRSAGEPGPYVLVGHSFGGAVAVTFAHRFPREVDGLLLVDASPADWPAAVCAVPADGSPTAAGFGQTCRSFAADHNPERLDAELAFAQVGRIESLGELPMSVLTRAHVSYAGLPADRNQALDDVWHAGQVHWRSLSSRSALVPVEHTSHYIQLDQPAVVIEHVQRLL